MRGKGKYSPGFSRGGVRGSLSPGRVGDTREPRGTRGAGCRGFVSDGDHDAIDGHLKIGNIG